MKNLFLASEPLAGWRTVRVTDRRTTEDWVTSVKQVIDEHYPNADCIQVVLDNPAPTNRKRSMSTSTQKRCVASWTSSNSTSRQSMAVGSTWQKIEFNRLQ